MDERPAILLRFPLKLPSRILDGSLGKMFFFYFFHIKMIMTVETQLNGKVEVPKLY